MSDTVGTSGSVQPFNLCSTSKTEVERPQGVGTSGFVQPFNLDNPNPHTGPRARRGAEIQVDQGCTVEQSKEYQGGEGVQPTCSTPQKVEQRLDVVYPDTSHLCGHIAWADLTPGEQIRRWRMAEGLLLSQLADLLWLSVDTLRQIESDEIRPKDWPQPAQWLLSDVGPDLKAGTLLAQREAS